MAGDDDVLGPGLPGGGDEARPRGADDAERVRLVDDEDRPDLGGEGDEVLDRGGVAEHRVDRLDDDDGAGALAPGEQLGDVLEVVVARHRDGRPRQPAAVDQAGVGVLVADDERAGVGERGEHGEVRGVPAGEHQGERGPGQRREGGLELVVHLEGAGDQPRGPGTRRRRSRPRRPRPAMTAGWVRSPR